MGRTHHFALRVYFEDTDVAGIVYHANYLKFIERARSDMLRAAGIDQRAAIESGEGVYVVAEAHIKYRAPARLDDDLLVLSEVELVRAASCTHSSASHARAVTSGRGDDHGGLPSARDGRSASRAPGSRFSSGYRGKGLSGDLRIRPNSLMWLVHLFLGATLWCRW